MYTNDWTGKREREREREQDESCEVLFSLSLSLSLSYVSLNLLPRKTGEIFESDTSIHR